MESGSMTKIDQLKDYEFNDAGNDSFDHFLKNQLQKSQPYLADDNFTARVISNLPAPKKLSVWQERLIILVPLFVISLLVISQFSVLGVLIKLWVLAVSMDVTHLVQIGMLLSIAVISGASLWFARQLKII
jgi:hypothetical protein